MHKLFIFASRLNNDITYFEQHIHVMQLQQLCDMGITDIQYADPMGYDEIDITMALSQANAHLTSLQGPAI